jgi:hypothetical protein
MWARDSTAADVQSFAGDLPTVLTEDRHRWACALEERCQGAPVFVAERIGALVNPPRTPDDA